MKLFNRIHFRNLWGDIFGGVTAAIVSVSLLLALAFGVASGAGPITGLYGAVCVGFFVALFKGTPTLISEPTGPMIVVMTTITASLIARNPENGLAMVFNVVILAGIFQIIFLAIIFLMPAKFNRIVSPQLVALIVGTVISLVVFPNAEISHIGEIPMGLPTLQMPTFTSNELTVMFVNGVMLRMLGCIDTLLTAFYLSGPMIFGVLKAIAREPSAIKNSEVMILDLSDVFFLGVTASLAIENVIKAVVLVTGSVSDKKDYSINGSDFALQGS